MLSFLGTQNAHDTCEYYCPGFVYNYLKAKGVWDHIFTKSFFEQLTESDQIQYIYDFAQENPLLTIASSAVFATGLTMGVVYAYNRQTNIEQDDTLIDRVKKSIDKENNTVQSRATNVQTSNKNPKSLPTQLLLQSIRAYMDNNKKLSNEVLANNLGITKNDVENIKSILLFAKVNPSLYQKAGKEKELLLALQLPEDGSYPSNDTHYVRLIEVINMHNTNKSQSKNSLQK